MTVFRIEIDDEFCAAHAIDIRGEREPVHGHNWQVTVTLESSELDEDGLVCDFHDVQGRLSAILDPFRNRALNEIPPFHTTNPTAEHVALHIGTELQAALPSSVRVLRARVSEAPGCRAEVCFAPRDES